MLEAESLQEEAAKQIGIAESRRKAADEGMEKLQAEETARKQRFGFLQSAFAKEKAAMQEKLDISSRSLTSQQAAVHTLQKV